MIHYITGGERSGKSREAQCQALGLSNNPVYLATARRWDADFEKRIHRHQQERDQNWLNLEEERYPSKLLLEGKTIVLDCVTLWLTNIFTDLNYNLEACLQEACQEFDRMVQVPATWIIISNEIGMGVHASHESARKFVELQGWVNQYIAARADTATLMVSGIAVKIK